MLLLALYIVFIVTLIMRYDYIKNIKALRRKKERVWKQIVGVEPENLIFQKCCNMFVRLVFR